MESKGERSVQTRWRRRLQCLAAAFLVSVGSPSLGADDGRIVIAHRGASGYLPEHTLAAYAMAYAQGADYIEPDLARTRDGAFICLHDIRLEATTDVESRFPDRHRADGRWYAADFDLAEIRQLRVHERLEGRFPRQGARFFVPTFEEMIELVQGLNSSVGRTVGIYPELKSPAWHREQGLAMEEPFLEVMQRYGFYDGSAPVFVQSFELAPLERMRALGSPLPQIMLMGRGPVFDAMATRRGLAKLAELVDGIGPAKERLVENPELVTWAHSAGLLVHPYTFRADSLPPGVETLEDELRSFFVDLGVDGLFTDFPDRARVWIDRNLH